MPSLKLYYFDSPGKAEAIRLFCAYAGIPFEDFRFSSRDEFTKMKLDGTLPFGQVPMLEIDGTHKIPQSSAILRYLYTISGLAPEDPVVAAKVDAAMDQDADAFAGATVTTYSERFGFHLSDENKAKTFQIISDEILPRHFANVEKLLLASSTGFLAGTDKPSPADFIWFCRFVTWVPQKPEFTDKIKSLDDFPAIKTFVEKMKSLDAVKAYYAK